MIHHTAEVILICSRFKRFFFVLAKLSSAQRSLFFLFSSFACSKFYFLPLFLKFLRCQSTLPAPALCSNPFPTILGTHPPSLSPSAESALGQIGWLQLCCSVQIRPWLFCTLCPCVRGRAPARHVPDTVVCSVPFAKALSPFFRKPNLPKTI